MERHASAEPLTELAEHPAAAAVLALASSHQSPAELRARVLAGALAARPAGRPAVGVGEITPPAALRRTLQELADLVASLDERDAIRPTIEGWTVAGLLGHLTAIEEHTGAVLGWWPQAGPIEREDDHLAMTLPAVHAAQSQLLSEVRAHWAEVVDRVVTRLDTLEPRLAERARLHGLDLSIRSLVVARTFEVWTHTEDIGRAVGRPVPDLDPARLRLMCDTAVRALPLGMLLNGTDPADRTVRIVLTGDGGGSWVQALALGAAPGEPTLTLVAGAVEFCRVAAKRTAPSALACTIDGDADLAPDVLAAAAVFAA